jgi:O-methyltransferase
MVLWELLISYERINLIQPTSKGAPEMLTTLAKHTFKLPQIAVEETRYQRIYRKFKAFTMIDERQYIGNLRLAAEVSEISGCIVECGTWRGGMSAGIAEVLGPSRKYYLFDSFQGLPPAREIDGSKALAWQSDIGSPGYLNNCSASEEEARYAVSQSPARNYKLIKGWFADTLPGFCFPEPIALLRLDADWYDSTKCVIDNLGGLVAPGGLIIVDDYYTWDGCTKATNEAAAEHNWKIRQSRFGGVCFIRVD